MVPCGAGLIKAKEMRGRDLLMRHSQETAAYKDEATQSMTGPGYIHSMSKRKASVILQHQGGGVCVCVLCAATSCLSCEINHGQDEQEFAIPISLHFL